MHQRLSLCSMRTIGTYVIANAIGSSGTLKQRKHMPGVSAVFSLLFY